MEEETTHANNPNIPTAMPDAALPFAPPPLAPLPLASPLPLPAATPLPLPSPPIYREPIMERVTEQVDHMKGETLTMANPGRIFPYIMAQESTHFQFKTKEMERRFQHMIEQIPDLTVRFDYGREDKSDILLVSSSDPTQIVGKLHLLLVDRRDRGDPSKRYVKIHLFHMKDPQQFELVRQRVTDFFEKIGQPVRVPMTRSQKKKIHQERRMIVTRKQRPRLHIKRSIKHASIKRNNTKRNSIKRSIKSSHS
jgi:hypothetical protein